MSRTNEFERDVKKAYMGAGIYAIFAVFFTICAAIHLVLGTIFYAAGAFLIALFFLKRMRDSETANKEDEMHYNHPAK